MKCLSTRRHEGKSATFLLDLSIPALQSPEMSPEEIIQSRIGRGWTCVLGPRILYLTVCYGQKMSLFGSISSLLDSYKMWSEIRPGPRDKVPNLRILGRRWLYFEANCYLSATEVHTRAAACDSGAVRLVNSGVLWMDSP
jgi:hypothetical protein